MSRPSVLVVDPDALRRKELTRGLAELGYEAVPAIDAAEGRRFAAGLGPGIVVAPASLPGFGDGAVLATFPAAEGGARRTLLLLGRPGEEQEVPEEILFLEADGLPGAELVPRIHLALLGREIGVEPDAALESLVGDFSLFPPLELLRALERAGVSGKLVCAEGEVALAGGAPVAARAGAARGIKAFCRLGQLVDGPFWVQVRPGPPPGADPQDAREIDRDLKSLIFRVLEDRVHGAPDPRTRARVMAEAGVSRTRLDPIQREILAALPNAVTVARLVDELPHTDGELLRGLLALAELGAISLEEPQDLVRVVTDSTADLPAELARAHGIHVVPLQVIFGNQIFLDGENLRPREFYARLEEGRHHPRTNPPGKDDFLHVYQGLAGRKDVVSLHISGKLSQTVVHARAAAEEGLPRFQAERGAAEKVALRVVDSGNVSLGLGLLALFAARMARRGIEPDEIAERLESMRERVHVLFVVDTLEYLARGGRIGKARAIFGGLLGIKPILGVVEGEVAAVDRVRGGRAAHPRLVELFRERVDAGRPVSVSVAHAKAPVWADRLRALVEKSFDAREVIVGEMGPVVGTHAGPGTVGAAFFQPTEEELPLVAPLSL